MFGLIKNIENGLLLKGETRGLLKDEKERHGYEKDAKRGGAGYLKGDTTHGSRNGLKGETYGL